MVKLVELSERTELEAFNFTGRGFGCQANITTFLDIFLNLFIILRLTDFPPEVEGGGRKEKKKKDVSQEERAMPVFYHACCS